MLNPPFCRQCGLNLWLITSEQQLRHVAGYCPRCAAPLPELPLTLAALQQSIAQAHAPALVARQQQRAAEIERIDTTIVQVISAMQARLGTGKGWFPALRLLLDPIAPLAIDMLQSPLWPLVSMRVEGIIFMPEIAEVATVDGIRQAIEAAIDLGAPAYNSGDMRTCAMQYWITAFTLAHAPVDLTSGPVGPRAMIRILQPLRQATTERPVAIGNDLRAIGDFAWLLRHSFNASLAVIKEQR